MAPRPDAGNKDSILGESAFPKRGDHSVGEARQWCCTLGQTVNGLDSES